MLSFLLPLYVSLISLVSGYDEAELLFVGDAMQHQAQLDAARSSKSGYDYSAYFSAVEPYVREADFAVANLETPVGAAPYSGYPCFNAPPAFAKALSDAGFDLLLTANNHTLDRGAKGLKDTIATLDSLGIAHIGTYADDSARVRVLPKIVSINNIKFGFLNYTYGTNGIEPRDGVVVDYIDRASIKADVEAARQAGAELVAVCIHWGDEYKLLPNKQQKHTADFLEAIGVDLVIGSHPHVIQPMELRPNRYKPEKNIFIVYSLGNFISNMRTPDTRGGAMARIKIRRGADRKPRIEEADYRLVFTVPGTSPANNFRLVEPSKIDDAAWKDKAALFAKRARAIFDEHNIGVPEAAQ